MPKFHHLKISAYLPVFRGAALLGFALILLTLFLPGEPAAARRDQDKFREMGMNPYLEILPGKVHWNGAYLDDRATELFDMIENKVGY